MNDMKIQQRKGEYSQLSRKRPHLGHDKVVAYGRWSLMGKINKISLILDWLINYTKTEYLIS